MLNINFCDRNRKPIEVKKILLSFSLSFIKYFMFFLNVFSVFRSTVRQYTQWYYNFTQYSAANPQIQVCLWTIYISYYFQGTVEVLLNCRGGEGNTLGFDGHES